MDKMQKTARGLDVFFKILFWLLAVLGAALIVLNVAAPIIGYGSLLGGERISLFAAFGGIAFGGTEMVYDPAAAGRALILGSVAILLLLCAALFGIHTVRRMLAPMKEGQPFDSSVSSGFLTLGWLAVGYGVVYNLFDLFGKNLLAGMMAPVSGQELTLAVEHRLSIGFIVYAFVFFLCSYIFRYGEELQKLSDETL